MISKRRAILLSLWFGCISNATRAEVELLPPEQAFQIRPAGQVGRTVEFLFTAAPGFSLYGDKFHFQSDNQAVRIVAVELPPGSSRWDEDLRRTVTYYRGSVRVKLTIDGPAQPTRITATAQGCADIGVCYPPISKVFSVQGGRS